MKRRLMRRKALLLAGIVGFLAACNLGIAPTAITVTERAPIVIETATPDGLMGLRDASGVMAGVCFEAAYNRRDTPFVFRTPAELGAFFDAIDAEQSCRRPIERGTFDFSAGQALVGLWSYGVGCTAQHSITSVTRDDAASSLLISARLTLDGTCSYELLRPLWLGVEGAADVTLDVRR